jgi:hypothetical protein
MSGVTGSGTGGSYGRGAGAECFGAAGRGAVRFGLALRVALRRLVFPLATFFAFFQAALRAGLRVLRARAFLVARDLRVGFRLREVFLFFFEAALPREALRAGFFRREAFRFALFFATVSPPLKRVYQCTNDWCRRRINTP